MKMQQKSQRGRMPVTLNTKRAASKLLSIKEVIRGSKQQWKIVVWVSTLCQVLSETERVFCSNQASGNYSIASRQSRAPTWELTAQLHLSAWAEPFNHPPCKAAFRKKLWYCSYFYYCSLFLLSRDANTRTTCSMKKQETSFDKQVVGFSLESHSHLFSLWLRKHPQLPADPFTYCTHNASSSCYIHRWASVGAVGVSLRLLMLLAGYINHSFSPLQHCSRKAQRQIHESIHKHYKEIHKFSF